MEGLSGKRSLVTGAAGGLGKVLVTELYKNNAIIFALDQSITELNKLQEEFPKISIHVVDLTDHSATRKLLESILPLQLVVNAAALGAIDTCFTSTPEKIESLMKTNVYSMLNVNQVVSKDLIERKMTGSIVNVSSMASKQIGDGVNFSYALTKSCVDMMTRHFAFNLSKHGIRMNSVNPHLLDTGMGKYHRNDPAALKRANDFTLTKSVVKGQDVVNTIIFLLSDACKMILGHNLPVDGGASSR